VRLKKKYGEDIKIEVIDYIEEQSNIKSVINQLNNDKFVSGIVLQLPISNPDQTDELVRTILQKKDVDGLNNDSDFISATAMAINWLLAGYNVDLKNKKISIVGNGRLVGAPLYAMWKKEGLNASVYDDKTKNLQKSIYNSDIVITATGVPELIKDQMLKKGAVIVDAGTASEKGKIVGDLEASARDRKDLIATPEKGGVGPLTIAALFDNVIQAARQQNNIN
jgi:methylenetetrahydrofolate dehydrogenase (NADP+)/methenyltetrahydrofolate cyclohydrolase